MADEEENPRKKQKLEAISINTSEIPTSSDQANDSKINEESYSLAAKEQIQDGTGRLKTNQTDISETELPSSSQADLDDSDDQYTSTSSLSPMSGEEMWKGDSEPIGWVYQMMASGANPRTILEEIMPQGVPDVDEFSLWRLLLSIVSEPPPREKLDDVNTIGDVIKHIRACQNIIVLTGAGVSVSCGIPDFRSRDGIYSRLAVDFPDLPDPQAMFDIRYFRGDQRPFYKFAKEIYPGQFEPSKCHRFIKLIEDHGKLLRNYTQNIDTLEQVAGIENVIQCHGSFATATCMTCKYKCSGDDIKQEIFEQVIPKCPKCDPPTEFSIMKPDIVFFGESLPEEFHRQMAADKEKCDLLIVMGSSLKVRPVALIPNSLPGHVPQILINKEHLKALNFDVELLGDCEVIIGELCRHLGDSWNSLANTANPLTEIRVEELLTPPGSPKPYKDGGINADVDKSKISDDAKPKSDITSLAAETSSIGEDKSSNIKVNDNSNKTDDKIPSGSVNVRSQGSNDKSETMVSSTQDSSCEEVPGTCQDKLNDNSEAKPSVDSSGANTSIDKENNNGSKEVDSTAELEKGAGDGPDVMKRSQRMWVPAKWKVSKRLTSNQYCYIPPNRYVFNDAEVFMEVDSDSDNGEADTDSELDNPDKLNQSLDGPNNLENDSNRAEGAVKLGQFEINQNIDKNEQSILNKSCLSEDDKHTSSEIKVPDQINEDGLTKEKVTPTTSNADILTDLT